MSSALYVNALFICRSQVCSKEGRYHFNFTNGLTINFQIVTRRWNCWSRGQDPNINKGAKTRVSKSPT